jgi:hypothetical protein
VSRSARATARRSDAARFLMRAISNSIALREQLRFDGTAWWAGRCRFIGQAWYAGDGLGRGLASPSVLRSRALRLSRARCVVRVQLGSVVSAGVRFALQAVWFVQIIGFFANPKTRPADRSSHVAPQGSTVACSNTIGTED